MLAVVVALLLTPGIAGTAGSQSLPFAPGERLTYGARIGSVGRGAAVMSVEGPVQVRGYDAYHLRFEIRAKVGFVRVLNVSDSWLDAPAMSSLRFRKREQHPLAKQDQSAEIFPAEQRWEGGDGGSGRTIHDQPLDELSFIYFLRTLRLPTGGALRFDRHFEASRNPTLVKVVGNGTLETKAGTFATIVVEMQVRDGRYGEGGTIRLHLSDDERRLPVRIESRIPVAGKVVLMLESFVGVPGRVALP